LHPGPPLRHVDRTGHGTHVAAIAAGGIHFTRRGDASRVGIAPEAFIIAVKFHDLRRPAVYHGTNIIVPVEQRLRDAVYYCLRTAHGMDMPVVVNMSFGRGSAAGDGLDPFAMFVDKLLDPTNAQVVAGPINTPMTFPKGAIVVRSAGNEGEKDRGARITIPASGSVVLPLVLDDSRILPTKATTAGELPHAPEISVQCWWRPEAAGPVRFAIRLPHLAGSSSEFSTDPMDADGNAPPLSAELCFDMLAGPPVTTHVVPSDPKAHAAIFRLEAPPPVVHSPGRTVRRRHLTFSLRPKTGGSVSYAVGNYALVIRGPPGIVIHVLCEKTRWEPQSFVTFRIPGTAGSAIQVGSAFSAVDALGRHAITVAAYDDKQGQNVPGRHAIYDSSARGPLRDFSDPANKLGPIAPKPDIAAPGVGITSALSASAPNLMGPLSVDWHAGNRFSTLTGTSLAGPIVAGVIATLLGKKPDLNTSEVRKKLRVHARAGVEPPLEATVDPSLPSPRERAYGAGMVDAFASFKNLLP
jgi:subtilisin family serine protease